jgi:hypothetical protein
MIDKDKEKARKRRYNHSAKGILRNKRYDSSEKRQIVRKKYEESIHGWVTRRKYKLMNQRKKIASSLEAIKRELAWLTNTN